VTSRTVGVEEEFLLANPETGQILSLAPRILRTAGDGLEEELTRQQLETGTEPRRDLAGVRAELVRLRRSAADSAAAEGAALLAVGTSPVPVTPVATTEDRYLRMMDHFGQTAREQLTCGCHVHVGVESRAEAIGALDRMRTWLPCLLAIATNSPFWQGEDTGYASYRTQVWDRWPSAGGTGAFGSETAYDALLDGLVGSGVVLDRAMIYFDARPSERYSTLELRVADVCLDLEDAVLVAALGRALVNTAAAAWARGEPMDETRQELLRAARWRAARSGLGGGLVDPATGVPAPAGTVLGRLVAHVRPALEETGDLDLVTAGIERVLGRGTGADRQRAAGRQVGAPGILRYAAEETLAGC
jgi:carboxylate-amine ligase